MNTLPSSDPRMTLLCVALGGRWVPLGRSYALSKAKAKKVAALHSAGFMSVLTGGGWRFCLPGGRTYRLSEALNMAAGALPPSGSLGLTVGAGPAEDRKP